MFIHAHTHQTTKCSAWMKARKRPFLVLGDKNFRLCGPFLDVLQKKPCGKRIQERGHNSSMHRKREWLRGSHQAEKDPFSQGK